MLKKVILIHVVFCLILFFIVPVSNALDPQWKEHQQAMLDQMGLKAGEKITKDNWQKIEGLVPDDILSWVKDGRQIIIIGEMKYDFSHDDEWLEWGEKHNTGKYALDERQNIIEVETGDFPGWVYGHPFPNIDLKNDPDAAIKLCYNRDISRGRDSVFKGPFTCEWIGENGFERVIQNTYWRFNFWGNKFVKDDGNENKEFFYELTNVVAPYDVSGTAQLTIRALDGSEDKLYVYIPAIRRTKRMSGANRSDPFMGADFSVDDANGWAGQTSNMTWKYLGEKPGLMVIGDFSAENLVLFNKQKDGSYKQKTNVIGMKVGWEVPDCEQAPWAQITAVWVPRMFHMIEAVPNDPYYNMGKMIFWFDKTTLWCQYKLMDDIAGDYWKTGIFWGQGMRWKDGLATQTSNGHLFYDTNTKHATVLRACGMKIYGRDLMFELNLPNMKKKMSVSRLGTWTK